MYYLKRSIIYAFIWCNTVFVVLAEKNCFPNANPEVFNWENDDLKFADVEHDPQPDNRTFIFIYIRNITDDFNLTVYVNPYANASTNCALNKPDNSRNLFKFYQDLPYKKGNDNRYLGLLSALSGCYYVKLTNTTGHHCMKALNNYVNMSTILCDWNLKSERDADDLKPGDNQTPARYVSTVTIAHECVDIEVKLFRAFQANETCNNDLIGKCKFTNHEKSESCELAKDGLDFEVNRRRISSNTEHWEAEITWNNLISEEASYASQFTLIPSRCPMSYENCMTWVPAYEPTALFYVGLKGFDNENTPPLKTSAKWQEPALGILLVLILVTILIYWIRIWIKAGLRRKNYGTSQPEEGLEEIEISDSNILLMYVKGSPESIDKIMYYQNRLKEKCHHHVYSIHSLNGPTTFEDLGLTAWIENMMKVNSKFVWFDTPEFRLYLKNDSDQQNHRNLAIPYAIRMTKTVLRNVYNQYRQHFVVRLEGLDVSDGKEDPLLVISPNIRYYLPQHFDALCTDLNK